MCAASDHTLEFIEVNVYFENAPSGYLAYMSTRYRLIFGIEFEFWRCGGDGEVACGADDLRGG
jgi:hypothetical protein